MRASAIRAARPHVGGAGTVPQRGSGAATLASHCAWTMLALPSLIPSSTRTSSLAPGDDTFQT